MKKQKEESSVKTAKKKAREAIQLRLVKAIKTIAVELGQEVLDIEKEAKKLAKKITKGLKIAKKTDKITPPAGDAKKAAAPKEKTVSKPTVVIVKKPVTKTAPSKPAAPKAEPVKAVPSKTTAPKAESAKSVPQKKAKK